MIYKFFLALILSISICGVCYGQATEFTYQGQLQSSSAVANGNFDFEFALFDAQSGGSQLGSTQTRNGVGVANGIFSVNLDFGNLFPGTNRFLEIRVRQSGGGAFTALSPRQSISSAPYAVKSINAESSTVAVNAITANNATNAQNSVNFSGQLAGDVTGNQGSTTVARLQGRSVTNATPTSGQVLKYNGAQWEPANATPAAGSPDYIQNTAVAQPFANFNIGGNGTAAGTLSGSTLNATTQLNLGGTRILTATNEFFGSIYFGFGAGTNGLANTFFGYQAGQANSTSNFAGGNSFFGRRAGTSNTDGGDNSFYGSDAGTGNTIGSRNSFFGRSAGASVTEGLQNSFFGRSAGLLTTTGESNTFVGANSGFGNTIGSNNSLLGSSANIGPNVSFGTAIGSGAIATQSNTVVLGRPTDAVNIPGSLDVTGNITGNFTVPATNITGVLTTANGGTGLVSPGISGSLLRSNGSVWTTSQLIAADLPTGSGNYIQNQNAGPQSMSNFNISGNGVVGGSLGVGQSSANAKLNIQYDGNPGNAGIRIASTDESVLDIDSATGASGFRLRRNGSLRWNIANSFSNDSLLFASSTGGGGALRMVMSSVGNLGIGATSPSIKLHVDSGTDAEITGGGYILAGSVNSTNLVLDNNEIMARENGATSTLFLNADGGDVNLIQNGSGNVGIGIASTPQDKLHVDGIIRVTTLGTAGATALCRNASQQISTCSSSLRYKTNFSAYRSGLDLVNQLKPLTFDWKGSGMHDLGLGAEDVAAIEPLLVTYNAKGEVEGVKYDRIGVVLVNAVKEQQKQIEKQYETIQRQQTTVEALRSIVCAKRRKLGVCKTGI